MKIRVELAVPAGLFLGLGLSACGGEDLPFEVPVRDEPAVDTILTDLSGLAFESFVEESYIAWLKRDPETVAAYELESMLGMEAKWLTNHSEDYVAETQRLEDGILAMMDGYDRAVMSTDMQIIYDAYQWFYEDRQRARLVAEQEYRGGVGLLPRYLFQAGHPMQTAEDADNFVFRVRQLPPRLDHAIAVLNRMQDTQVLEPRDIFNGYVEAAQFQIPIEGLRGYFWETFRERSRPLMAQGIITAQKQSRLLEEIEAIEQEQLAAPLAEIAQLMVDLSNQAPQAIGVDEFSQGPEYYAHALRHHTTTEMTAEQIHALGLSELETIQAAMEVRFAELGYPATESIFDRFERLRVDGGTLSGGEVIEHYEDLLSEAEGWLDPIFERVPQIPYEVVGGGGGAYSAPSIDGRRPGRFLAPTSGEIPVFDMKALAYHEALPGHHLQIALAIELDVPLFCRIENGTGYVEGWALYSERLAQEQGWYGDVESELGQLEFQAFRAARLVVDTGIHAFDWDFQRAVDFMREEAGLAEGMAVGQVYRYARWPGQATGYMVGMLEILRLRDLAQTQLGEQFGLPAFHSAVLNTGALPLEVLGTRVDAYIDRTRGN